MLRQLSAVRWVAAVGCPQRTETLIVWLRTLYRSIREEERRFLADALIWCGRLFASCATSRSRPRTKHECLRPWNRLSILRINAARFGLLPVVLAVGGLDGFPAHAAEQAEHVVLLVPGIISPRQDPDRAASLPNASDALWQDLVTFLTDQGYTFGGVIRPGKVDIHLPDGLARAGSTVAEPRQARLFALEFSSAANTDGLAARALELAQCLDELHRFTGKEISIVAYSAGGLVARCVLQRACPGIRYDGHVDRLITVATPHLGTVVADNLARWLGAARVDSLMTTAGLIRRLNSLPLPTDVQYACIVVRALGAGMRTPGHAYDALIEKSWRTKISSLPVDFQVGGDQVVHVRSQNLWFLPPVNEYEMATGRPVHTVLVRIPAKQLGEPGALRDTVHGLALDEPSVQRWIERFLSDDGSLWSAGPAPNRAALMRWQAEYAAFGAIESRAVDGLLGAVGQVFTVEVRRLDELTATGPAKRYRYMGTASRQIVSESPVNAEGVLELEFDRFGRITSCKPLADATK